jgi:hypothetical protein
VTESACVVCGAEKHPRAYACKRCKRILDCLETRRDRSGAYRRFDREARLRPCKTRGGRVPFAASTPASPSLTMADDGAIIATSRLSI